MKALSFQQPWAFAVLLLGKRTENRKRLTTYRGPVVMHISKGWDKAGEKFFKDRWETIKRKGDMSDPRAFLYYASNQRGGYAGVFEIADCQAYGLFHQNDPWAFGPWCYTLKNVKPFGEHPEIIPASGRLGFWEVPERVTVLDKLWDQIEEAKR